MPISTHILDIALGLPAGGVTVALSAWQGGAWVLLGTADTDADGRCRDLLHAGAVLAPALYRLRFETGAYHARNGARALHPFVEIAFEVLAGESHYHLPLLLTPFGYTTYRGT